MKNTQLEFVLGRLKENGRVSRNDCLRNYVSRLSGYICNLTKVGYEFVTSREGGDYIYKLVKDPTQPKLLTQDEMYDLYEPKIR